MQFSTSVRNAVAALRESHIGASPILRAFTGAAPANCAAASTGTLIFEMTLPADWLSQSNGVSSLVGTWQDSSANATGAPRYFRVFDSTGTTCHAQGTISIAAGSGELKLTAPDAGGADAGYPAIASGQPITISSFTVTEGGA